MGDSFMCRDPKFMHQHWSEMLPAFDVVNLSRAGWSNALIALTVLEYISNNAVDAVVLGFTDPLRLEFAAQGRHGADNAWITTNHDAVLTSDEKKCRDYFKVTRDLAVEANKSAMLISNLFSILDSLQIPFVFNYMMFEDFCKQLHPVQKQYLDRFTHLQIPHNLALDNLNSWRVSTPMFHVADIEQQKKFAKHVEHQLTLQLKTSKIKL